MTPHLLDGNAHAHLAACDTHDRVYQVQVWQLAIHAVVNDVDAFEPALLGVVDGDGALQRTRLERQAIDAGGIVSVMVGVYPCLWAGDALGCYQEDDILRPQRPALEVPGESQQQREAVAVQLILGVLPCCYQDNGLGGVAARCLEECVDVLARVDVAGGVVGEILAADLEAEALDDGFELVVDSAL